MGNTDFMRWMQSGIGAHLLLGTSCLFGVSALVATAMMIYQDRFGTLREAQERNTVLAQVLEEHARRSFDISKAALLDLEGPVMATGKPEVTPATADRMGAWTKDIPQIYSFWLIDAAGRVVFTTQQVDVSGVNYSDREYFKAHMNGEDFNVGRMTRGRIDKVWFFSLSKRLTDRDGNFCGVLLAAMRTDFFEALYSRLGLGPKDNIAIFRPDGAIVARRQVSRMADAGPSVAGHPLFIEYASNPMAGVYEGPSPIDHVNRSGAYRSVEGWPLIVASATDMDRLLASWRGRSVCSAAYCAAMLFALGFLTWWGCRRIKGEMRALAFAAEAGEKNALLLSEVQVANANLMTTQIYLRSMMDNIPHLTWLKDAEGRYLAINRAFARFLRLNDVDEGIGKTDLDLQSKEPAENYRADDAEVMASRQQKYVVEKAFDGDRVFWVETFKTPIIDADGNVFGTAGISSDITERKWAENELQVAATTFEASLDGIMITDPDGVILRVNQAFTKTTGYSAEEVLGRTPSILKSGRHDPAFYAEMWWTLLETGSWQGEIWDRRKDGEVYPKWLRITVVKAADGTVTHYVGVHTDITEEKTAEDMIKNLAFYDPLTQLPNRRLLMDRLRQTLAASIRSGREGALLFIDMDNFKTVNDTLGHDKGDLLLKEVARRLSTCVREGDTAARLGGDEFVVMLEGLNEIPAEAAAQAEAVGAKILATLGKVYAIAGQEIRSTPSIGITLFGNQRENIDELLKQADIAMYKAKSAGRNAMYFFAPALDAAVKLRVTLEADLRNGIGTDQLLLHYQPQMDVEGRLIGAEALVRWRHPDRGLVSPAEFIPLAEETGLILPLGNWVLETACKQLAAWATQRGRADLTVAVNVSAGQFRQPDFVDQVLNTINNTGANPTRLKLELTESLLIENVQDIIGKMQALKGHGVGFSLDDFGTGYSSLSYLKRLPLDQLKVDQSFVRDILIDPNDAAIARTVVALAESMGLGVIAEGVEIAEQRNFLSDIGCYLYQGYFYSKPLPVDAFEQFASSCRSLYSVLQN